MIQRLFTYFSAGMTAATGTGLGYESYGLGEYSTTAPFQPSPLSFSALELIALNLLVIGLIWFFIKKVVTQQTLTQTLKPMQEELTEINKRISSLESSRSAVEAGLKNVPGAKEIQDVQVSLARMGGDIDVLRATLTMIEKPLNLLLEQSIEGKPNDK